MAKGAPIPQSEWATYKLSPGCDIQTTLCNSTKYPALKGLKVIEGADVSANAGYQFVGKPSSLPTSDTTFLNQKTVGSIPTCFDNLPP